MKNKDKVLERMGDENRSIIPSQICLIDNILVRPQSQNDRVFGKDILNNVINGNANAKTSISLEKSKTIVLTRQNLLGPPRSATANLDLKGYALRQISCNNNDLQLSGQELILTRKQYQNKLNSNDLEIKVINRAATAGAIRVLKPEEKQERLKEFKL